MQKLLKLSIAATAAAATFSSTALFADPFSGVIVEGALGGSQIKGESWSVQTASGESDIHGGRFTTSPSVANASLDASKDTQFAGRVGVGYGYTLPIINLNLAGLLTYNVGEQKLKQNGIQGGDRPADLSGWTTKLKNAWELRLQPGYYILPIRTLVYGTIGYAQAKLDSSGRTFLLGSANGTGGPTVDPVGQGSVNLDGYVLGIGAKIAPIPLIHLYVGADYSHTTYNNKKISGQTIGDARALNSGTFPVSYEANPGKIKTDTFLVTVGYYF